MLPDMMPAAPPQGKRVLYMPDAPEERKSREKRAVQDLPDMVYLFDLLEIEIAVHRPEKPKALSKSGCPHARTPKSLCM